jgi:hypothetical protein
MAAPEAFFRARCVASIVMALASMPTAAEAAYGTPRPTKHRDLFALVGPHATSATDWWSTSVIGGKLFRLNLDGSIGAYWGAFHVAGAATRWERLVPLARFNPWVSELYWHVDSNEVQSLDQNSAGPTWLGNFRLPELLDPGTPRLSPFETIRADPALGIATLLGAPRPVNAPVTGNVTCPFWRVPQPVVFEGPGGDKLRIALLDCEGDISVQALDQLSVLGRQPGTPAPRLPLPMVPASETQASGEWVDGVRLFHPRLVWLLQQIALTFPSRSILIYSGYRRDARSTSRHLRGRAVDIAVKGVAKERLFVFCRSLRDTGCGYYPNQPFVHVDVRTASEGSGVWVDISRPGRPSAYVDYWPGIVSSGALEAPSAD